MSSGLCPGDTLYFTGTFVCGLQCEVYIVCTVCNVQCSVFSVQCVHCTMCSGEWSELCSGQCIVFSVHCTVCIVHCAVVSGGIRVRRKRPTVICLSDSPDREKVVRVQIKTKGIQ